MVYQSRGESFYTADKALQLANNIFTVPFTFNPFFGKDAKFKWKKELRFISSSSCAITQTNMFFFLLVGKPFDFLPFVGIGNFNFFL